MKTKRPTSTEADRSLIRTTKGTGKRGWSFIANQRELLEWMILSAGVSLQRKVVHYQEGIAHLLTTANVISLSALTAQLALLTTKALQKTPPFLYTKVEVKKKKTLSSLKLLLVLYHSNKKQTRSWRHG